jgi:hypothetical protein
VFGKIRGKADGDHVSIPVFMQAGKSNGTVQIVKPVKFGFNSPHAIQKPTQFEKLAKGKKKGAKPAPADPNSTWTSNVPMNPESVRDTFNCDVIGVLYKAALKEVMKPELWEAMDKDHMAPESEEEMASKFRSPLVDNAYEGGSQCRIKFAYNGFNKQKRFVLYDCRLSKKGKLAAIEEKGKKKGSSKKKASASAKTAFPSISPGSIRDGNAIAGTAQVVSRHAFFLHVLSFIGRKTRTYLDLRLHLPTL